MDLFIIKNLRCFYISVLLVLFFGGGPLNLMAKKVKPGGKVDVGMPRVLKGNEEGIYKLTDLDKELCQEKKWGQNIERSNKYWKVWSDRDNNVVYSDARKRRRAKRCLDFAEPVIIAYIKDNMALVYQDEDGQKWPDISKHPKQIGWVEMDHLLLWDRCPTDDYFVQRKAMIANNMNEIGQNKNASNFRYTSPEGDINPQNLEMKKNFYFIMKTEGRRALLCSNPAVNSGGGNLFGWVDQKNLLPYNRICLEPNWDPDYVEHHKDENLCVYYDQSMTPDSSFFCWTFGTSNGDKDYYTKYRMDPQMLRFPLLDIDYRNNRARCVGFATSNSKPHVVYFCDGYVPLKDIEGNDYWHYIIFMSLDELVQLLQNLKETYLAANDGSDERDKYGTAVRALIKNMTGQTDDQQIDNMSINDLQQLIYGLNVSTGLTKRTLNEITDKSKVNRAEYLSILKKFAKKYESLKAIFDHDYRYKAIFGGMSVEYNNKNIYYWIPIEELPFNED